VRFVLDTCYGMERHGLSTAYLHGHTAFMLAAQHGHTHVCERLARHGADINSRDKVSMIMPESDDQHSILGLVDLLMRDIV